MHPIEFERKKRTLDIVECRAWAENDLEAFTRFVSPQLLLGECHVELMQWIQSPTTRMNKLILMPRGHLKSRLMAIYCAWVLVRDPTETILYLSATMDLAEKQLTLIKQLLLSPICMKFWPDMVNSEESKRRRWTSTEIALDHPSRAREQIRDPSVKAAGLTSNITGSHATLVVLDDIVVPNNAYTNEGRLRVRNAVSQIAAIKEPDRPTIAVGTRYHPEDEYGEMMSQNYDMFDPESGGYLGTQMIYDVYTRVVETDGVFLWPRAKRPDGRWFGFDQNVLARIRGEYSSAVQFYANYYNEPNDLESEQISSDFFQEFDSEKLHWQGEKLLFQERKLNVFAAIDFAFSRARKADFTAVVVIGVDYDHNIYVLEIHRFKTDKISEYFDAIRQTHLRWKYRKLRAEVTVAQQAIVRDLKDSYIKPEGLRLSVDEIRPNRFEGDKKERIMAILEPKYMNYQVWHSDSLRYKTDLEDELVLENAATDDIINALADAIDVSTPPSRPWGARQGTTTVPVHGRFGGISHGG